jgi:hypothetical protein
VAVPVLLPLGGSAFAQDGATPAVRALGNTTLGLSTTASSVGAFCVTAGANAMVDCDLPATATITVSAATKAKFELRSTRVAHGAYVKAGEGGSVKLVATRAMRKKLKASRGRLLPVTYRLRVTSPITKTVSKKVAMRIGGSPTKQLVLRSSGDTFAVSGGRD